jgi:CelD/BcsL family acetyltransferase involved in cellulose biosynthesis
MAEPPAIDFYRAMLRRLALTGDARVILARSADQDIGFIFGGMCAGIYRGQQFSFDSEWARFSVGSLMQWEQVRWLCEENAHRYDMGPILAPAMAYKRHWTELRFPIESWFLVQKHAWNRR